MQRRRVVEVSELAPPNAKLWAYSYADLADFLVMTEEAVRQAVSRGRFDPSDLQSVYLFKLGRRGLSEGRRRVLEGIAGDTPKTKEGLGALVGKARELTEAD